MGPLLDQVDPKQISAGAFERGEAPACFPAACSASSQLCVLLLVLIGKEMACFTFAGKQKV